MQEKIIAKFSNTRSIQRVALTEWVNEQSVFHNISRLEEVVVNYYMAKTHKVDNNIQTFRDIIKTEYWIELRGEPCNTQTAY